MLQKRVGTLILALVIVGLFIGCSSDESSSVINPKTTLVSYDLSVVITVGDRSYIPINKKGEPADNPSEILLILKAFEDIHPELEIVDWKIESRQRTHGATPRIFGIWVDHKPKN